MVAQADGCSLCCQTTFMPLTRKAAEHVTWPDALLVGVAGRSCLHLPGAAGYHGHEGSRSRVGVADRVATPKAPFTVSAAVVSGRKIAAHEVIQVRRTQMRQGSVGPRLARGAISERAAGALWVLLGS